MKKTFCYICMTALLVTGCYKAELNQIDKEINTLSSTEVASLDTQVKNIKQSLENLPFLSIELKDYIIRLMNAGDELQIRIDAINKSIAELKAVVTDKDEAVQTELIAKLETAKSSLEAQLSATRAVVDVLSEKYASLEASMTDLEEYADGQFATLDFVSGTYATLEKQNGLISEVEAIKAQLDGLEAISVQLTDEVVAFIDTEVHAAKENAEADIAAMVDDVTAAIAAAAQQTKDTITAAYTQEIADAISKTEASVMEWVSAALNDYYTVAQAEAQILAFKTLIGAVPADQSLQAQIDDIAAQVAETKKMVVEAYQKAILEAIEKCEGVIKGELAEKINGLRDNELKTLSEGVAYLEGEVSKLWEDLGKKEIRINSLDDQVKAIKASLAVLDELGMTLKEYVEAVQNALGKTDADNLDALTKLINALNTSPDGKSLQGEIDSLKKYVGTIPTGDESISAWIENTIANYEASYKLYATVGYVEGLCKEVSDSAKDHSTRLTAIETKLSTIINDSKDTIDGWITEALSTYMTSSTFDGKLSDLKSALERLFTEGDTTLNNNITALNSKINSTLGELKTAYESAISSAITNYNGYVSDEVKKVFDKADGEINTLGTEITGIENTVNGIKNDITALNLRITTAKNDIAALLTFIKDSGYENLLALVTGLKTKVDALPTTYASLSDFNTVNNTVNGTGGYAETVAQLSTFATDLGSAESLIAGYKSIIGEFSLSGDNIDSLKTMMDDVLAQITTLKNTVFGTGSADGLRKQLNDIITLVNSTILPQLSELEKMMLQEVSDFTSIAYVPKYSDGMAKFSSSGDTIEFEIRPKGIASAVASNAALYYISTPTRALDMEAVSNVTITGDNGTGIITARLTSSIASLARSGISVVLVVKNAKYDFASEFIPVYNK